MFAKYWRTYVIAGAPKGCFLFFITGKTNFPRQRAARLKERRPPCRDSRKSFL